MVTRVTLVLTLLSTYFSMKTNNLPRYAPLVLRLTLAAVYLWFGFSQLTAPNIWTSMVPEWATGMSGMGAPTIIHLNGVFEIVASILLILGLGVRYVALVLAGHLLVVAYELGWNATGVRDFGLSFSTLALALFGDDEFSLGAYLAKKRNRI
jgi:uncharacterized membrane protein YphA (DoxX/SURF4 family)